MTKAEWDALDDENKDGMVAERVMRWTLDQGAQSLQWIDPNGFGRWMEKDFKPTTDRNASALVLDEIDRRNLRIEFEDALSDEGDDPAAFIDARYAIEWALRLSPDFICFCAVKAAEDV